eukprot:TRINITY_DN11842_c0_g1_i1.p2 TRINITY_DN11842_c0_g1~~TRINITY_DN11842_c0_g1_i1.p2  ORF type:complete len:113 (+),score=10.93 TRINITY_DN11842_c0_g1_i1:182-520(+)
MGKPSSWACWWGECYTIKCPCLSICRFLIRCHFNRGGDECHKIVRCLLYAFILGPISWIIAIILIPFGFILDVLWIILWIISCFCCCKQKPGYEGHGCCEVVDRGHPFECLE